MQHRNEGFMEELQDIFCVVGEDGSFKVGENMKIYFGVFKVLNRRCWATSLCFSF